MPQPLIKSIKILKFMKTKLIFAAALIGVANLSAHAGVRFGFSFGLPSPVPVVVTAPVAPVVVSAPVVAVPSVVVTTPAYPAPGYVWAPGYWAVSGYSRVWVPGCWRCRPVPVGYAHPHGWRRW
jgi:hypothetical protein